MKTSNQHNNNITKLHKEKLGMDIPDNFFAKSKEDILGKVIPSEKPKQKVFWLKPIFAYPVAASIILAIAISFWMQNKRSQVDNQVTTTEDVKLMNFNVLEGDFLVSSLFVPDAEMSTYLDYYMVNEVLIEAEQLEQQFENIFINSLFIEDSLINEYLNKSVLGNIII